MVPVHVFHVVLCVLLVLAAHSKIAKTMLLLVKAITEPIFVPCITVILAMRFSASGAYVPTDESAVLNWRRSLGLARVMPAITAAPFVLIRCLAALPMSVIQPSYLCACVTLVPLMTTDVVLSTEATAFLAVPPCADAHEFQRLEHIVLIAWMAICRVPRIVPVAL